MFNFDKLLNKSVFYFKRCAKWHCRTVFNYDVLCPQCNITLTKGYISIFLCISNVSAYVNIVCQ